MSYTTTTRGTTQRRPPRAVGAPEAAMLVVFLAINAAVAALGTATTISQVDGWYARAPHVAWTPPGWAFGVVWTVLYTLIAVSGWLAWQQRGLRPLRVPFTLYIAQLVLNALWTPIFFGGHALIGTAALWVGVVVIVLLDVLLLATVAAFWPVSRIAALLLLPYLVWVLYATTLNWGDAVLISIL